MDSVSVGLALLVVVCWSLNAIVKKKTCTFLSPHESLLVHHSIITVMYIVFFIFMFYVIKSETINVNHVRQITTSEWIYATFGAFLSFVSGIFLILLLSRTDVGSVMVICQPLTIVMSVILGMWFFSEEVSVGKLGGILAVCVGIFMLLKDGKPNVIKQ
jgi:uncharacterized membrane protein